MKIALGQINPIIADFQYNTSLIREASERAKRKGCSLVVFPELSLSGYPPKDLLEKPAFVDENLRQLHALATEIRGISVLCGYVDRSRKTTGKDLINSAALIKDGRVLVKGGKRLLPSYDVFDETRYFDSAPESLVFELETMRFGVTICEDIWNVDDLEGFHKYDQDPLSDLSDRGIDLLVNMSASPHSLNKRPLRMRILRKLSIRYGSPIFYCNQVGGDDELLFDGASMVWDRAGRLILLGKEFESDLIIWDSEQEYEEIRDPWPSQEATVLKALIMGTRDYASKCGFEKVLVGLSGGIDSALVAAIAQKAVGAENVMGVSMPSPYTQQLSRDIAGKVANNLGIRFEEIPIHGLIQGYRQSLADLFEGLEEDEAEENIQARIRGNLLMALSNKFNLLLLSTGNKSEVATGYCTLYGDLSGGLAVISDIPKTMCYRLVRYINRDREIIPEEVLARPPSAELRPNQADQDTLPPYEVLDVILEAAVEKNLGFDQIVALGHDPEVVRDVLHRLVTNEYKRRQSPPGLKITTKAFGYGRRYPIARGKQVY